MSDEQLDLAAQDEVQEEVERALEHGGGDLVRHRAEATGQHLAGPCMLGLTWASESARSACEERR